MKNTSKNRTRKSKKQRELEFDAEREIRRDEIRKKYVDSEQQWKNLGGTTPFHAESLEDYTVRELTAWVDEQPRVPTGNYQDPAKVQAAYHQRFVEIIRAEYPEVIGELRNLVPLFRQFFGTAGDRFELVFNRQDLSLFNLCADFDNNISIFGIHGPLLTFKPERWQSFENDYYWNEYKPMLLFLRLRSVAGTNEAERLITRIVKTLGELTEVDRTNLPSDADASTISRYLESCICQSIVSFFDPEKCESFFEQANNAFYSYLAPIFDDNNAKQTIDLNAFVELQLLIIDWSEKYGLTKDWLLRYAYCFIYQFSKSVDVKIEDLYVPTRVARSLVAPPFTFQFEEWVVSDRSAESYTQHLRADFEHQLTLHLDRSRRILSLDKQLRLGRPPKMERLRWLAIANIEKLSKPDILSRLSEEGSDDSPDFSSIYGAFDTFADLGLPVFR